MVVSGLERSEFEIVVTFVVKSEDVISSASVVWFSSDTALHQGQNCPDSCALISHYVYEIFSPQTPISAAD